MAVVDNLQRRGLAERKRKAKDRRIVTVHLTDRGEALIRDAFPGVVTALVGVFSVLTTDEQKQLAALCRRLGVAES